MKRDIEVFSKIYYKCGAKLKRGRIIQYIEFTDGYATRQVEEYQDKNEWFFCGKDSSLRDKIRMCDQPISSIEVKDENTIDSTEFETAWDAANSWKINNLVSA
jgi:hypothetical protein